MGPSRGKGNQVAASPRGYSVTSATNISFAHTERELNLVWNIRLTTAEYSNDRDSSHSEKEPSNLKRENRVDRNNLSLSLWLLQRSRLPRKTAELWNLCDNCLCSEDRLLATLRPRLLNQEID